MSVYYGVLADIHGNAHALRAVLAEARRLGVNDFLIAGDLVGYGPEPNTCVELVAELGATCVAGNHDLIVLGRLSDERCIDLARESLHWTRSVLSPDASAFLAGLPLHAEAAPGIVMAHGSLQDPQAYVSTAALAARELERLGAAGVGARTLILGHTHRPLAYSATRGLLRTRGTLALGPTEAALLNPGAVGQSREWRLRARLLILDARARRATFTSVSYDDAGCRRALERAGLSPTSHHLRPSPVRLAARTIKREIGAVRTGQYLRVFK